MIDAYVPQVIQVSTWPNLAVPDSLRSGSRHGHPTTDNSTSLTALRGLPLARAAADVITADPTRHSQHSWRCSTTMCFAGHVATIAGGVWLIASMSDEYPYRQTLFDGTVLYESSHAGNYLLLEDGDPIHQAETRHGHKVIHLARRAERLLGITHNSDESYQLFYVGYNAFELRALLADVFTPLTHPPATPG
jgi:hypothetical protein